MARNIIILAGITASGKSTTLGRLQPADSVKLPKGQPQLAGLPDLCFLAPSSFVGGPVVNDRQAAHPLPEGPVIVHWSFPACKRFGKSNIRLGLVTMASIKDRVETILLLICSYRCFINRMWHDGDSHRKNQFRYAADPAQVLENYEKFRDGCEAMGLEVHIVDTTKSNTFDFTDKSLHDILTDRMSLTEGKAVALRLLEGAGYNRIA